MQNSLIHRIVILVGFVISIVFFAVQIYLGYDLLEAAFTAACIMMAVSIILLISLQSVVKILFEHLSERQKHDRTTGNSTEIETKGNGSL